jgi:hypothetical protein
MKKSILLVACTLLMAFATQAQTADKPAANPNASEMTFEALEYNFGTIKQGDQVNYEFVFTNAGKDDLIITNATGSCGCTVPQYPKEAIKKGSKGAIKVTFNSAGKMGMQDKTVTITSNAKNSPVILHLKGTVEAPAPVANPATTPGK